MRHDSNSTVRQKGNAHEIRAHLLGNWGLLKNLIINALDAQAHNNILYRVLFGSIQQQPYVKHWTEGPGFTILVCTQGP